MEGMPGGCNPADVLFKLAHARGIKAPVFEQVAEHGPPHAKTFTCSCSFLESKYQSVGQGRSKKEARNASAKKLIEQLDLSTLPQKPQRHPGGQPAKRKKLDGGDEASPASGQPSNKKSKGKMSSMDPMMGGGMMHPLMSSSSYYGQEYGHGGFFNNMSMGMGYSPGMGMDHMGVGGFCGGMNFRGQFRPRINIEDRHVMERHQLIYPCQEELDRILLLVDTTEKALKRVSDSFLPENGEGERELMGVARVGDLAKGLLLKGDKEVSLVVMCAKIPSHDLLNKITEALRKEFNDAHNEETPERKYDVHMFPEESGLCVISNEMGDGEVPFQVSITLTSTLLRNQESGELQTEVKNEDSGLLCRKKGLNALAELRHSKWFTAMAANLSSCVESIRIMKDKAMRDPTWAAVGSWALEILVERALYSAGRNLSPSGALMRIMEVVASGLLMVDGPGIKDPCERDDICVFKELTIQMREDVTRQAQEDLRNVHFRKIHLVLGMDRLQPPGYIKKMKNQEGSHKQEIEDVKQEMEDVKQEIVSS